MYPSIKTLKTIAPERARELRKVLEIVKRSEIEALLGLAPRVVDSDENETKYPVTRKWYLSCYNPMDLTTAKMSIADEILGTHGVEYIPAGHNTKSPAIEYCNAGDPYITTLLYFPASGTFRVDCWGDTVERGHYY
jgi:hypothetical protein